MGGDGQPSFLRMRRDDRRGTGCSRAGGRRRWVAEKAKGQPAIRFEDATEKAGINFTHSFGSAQLGSLLEGTGAGCVWLDYDNDGAAGSVCAERAATGRFDAPSSAEGEARSAAAQPSLSQPGQRAVYGCDGESGLSPDAYSIAVTAADYDNDGYVDLLVAAYGKTILYHNDGNGHFTDVTAKAGIKVEGVGDQFDVAGLRQGRLRRPVCGPVCEVRSEVSSVLCGRQLSGAVGLRGRDEQAVPQQLRRDIHRCEREVGDRRVCGSHDGCDSGGL